MQVDENKNRNKSKNGAVDFLRFIEYRWIRRFCRVIRGKMAEGVAPEIQGGSRFESKTNTKQIQKATGSCEEAKDLTGFDKVYLAAKLSGRNLSGPGLDLGLGLDSDGGGRKIETLGLNRL
jgi:hypothetical protein